MSVLVDSRSSWMSFPQYPQPDSTFLKHRNDVELSRETLISVLTHLSTLIPKEFGNNPVRLVCHGGAVMLLHRDLNRLAQQQAASNGGNIGGPPLRTTTRDVDYIHRSFVTEYAALGFSDAGERLQRCIRATAMHFRLGADWMNSDADVALPMAADRTTGKSYDPIYTASIQPNNIHVHTIFTSTNSMLTLISVAPFWSIALKLVRYNPRDAGDIVLLLQNGTSTRGVQWTNQLVEDWLLSTCWPMGYAAYPPEKIAETRRRISHAVSSLGAPMATTLSFVAASSVPPVVPGQNWAETRLAASPPPPTEANNGWAGPSSHRAPGPSSLTWPASPPPKPWPQTTPQSPQQHHNLTSRSTVEEFDQSLNAFLGIQPYQPRVDTGALDEEYYDVKSRAPHSKKDPWSKYGRSNEKAKEKKAKKKPKKEKKLNKAKAQRARWMLSWTEPDDSDEYSESDDDYSDESNEDDWPSSDSWTMVSSQRSSPGLDSRGIFPPPPIQAEASPVEPTHLPRSNIQSVQQYPSDPRKSYNAIFPPPPIQAETSPVEPTHLPRSNFQSVQQYPSNPRKSSNAIFPPPPVQAETSPVEPTHLPRSNFQSVQQYPSNPRKSYNAIFPPPPIQVETPPVEPTHLPRSNFQSVQQYPSNPWKSYNAIFPPPPIQVETPPVEPTHLPQSNFQSVQQYPSSNPRKSHNAINRNLYY